MTRGLALSDEMGLLRLLCLLSMAAAAAGRSYRGGARRPHRDVATAAGVVRGYRLPQPPHYAFVGIPYGSAPTQPAMYKEQGPAYPWDSIFEATQRVRCPQPEGAGDVNCLVINVFTPLDAAGAPVLVHFHGGHFHSGWGNFEPPARLINEGIVVVTFNYRLGAAGFLCLGTEQAPGNGGLRDQLLALTWVSQNIERFGGDPRVVTAYGTGAGAASIEFLILSGAAEGLVHKAILESGSALSPNSMIYNPISIASDVAYTISGKEIDDLTEFYTNVSIDETLEYSHRFRPCVEKASGYLNGFVEQDPLDVLKSANFVHVPLLFVYTEHEGQAIVHEDFAKGHGVEKQSFDSLMPSNLDFYEEDVRVKIAESTKDFYFNNDMMDGSDLIRDLANYLGDTVVLYPLVKSAVMHSASSSNPVYLMEFSYKGRPSQFRDIEAAGASHGDVFRFIFSKERLNAEDELAAQRLTMLWNNFIRFGDPTPITTTQIPVVWQPLRPQSIDDVTLHSLNLLTFGSTITMKTTDNHHLAFWDRIYGKYYRTHLPVEDTQY